MSRVADALIEAWEFFGGDAGGPDFDNDYEWNLAHRWLAEYQEFPDKLRAATDRELELLARHGRTAAIRLAAQGESNERSERAVKTTSGGEGGAS